MGLALRLTCCKVSVEALSSLEDRSEGEVSTGKALLLIIILQGINIHHKNSNAESSVICKLSSMLCASQMRCTWATLTQTVVANLKTAVVNVARAA